MKHAYAVLVLALILVFALGSVAPAGILRGEDYDNLGGDVSGEGGEDDDHPWGGDRTIFGGDDGELDKTLRPSIATGLPLLDVVISGFMKYFDREEIEAAKPRTFTYQLKSSEYRLAYRQESATGGSSPIRTWKVAR